MQYKGQIKTETWAPLHITRISSFKISNKSGIRLIRLHKTTSQMKTHGHFKPGET